MGRRTTRNLKPAVEAIEPRVLLSVVTSIMASNHNAQVNSPRIRAFMAGIPSPSPSPSASTSILARGAAGAQTATATPDTIRGRFIPSSESIALPENQGYLAPANPGYNLILQPTGTATPAEVKRQLFKAVFRGPYLIAPGSYSSQALQVFMRGAGSSTSMLHCDIQLRLAVATDPTLHTTGTSVIFDRNLNSNTVLGLDLASPRTDVDARGRPNRTTTVTVDINASSGIYDEAFSQGLVEIHYYPSGKKFRGAYEHGTAVVKIYAQIYTAGVDFILRNARLNP